MPSVQQNSLPTICLQKDIDELFAKRKSLARSGNHTSTLSSIYYLRPLPEDAAPILYLLHAPKKFIKEAHKRNKLKRWIREAIRHSEEIPKIAAQLSEVRLQALLLFRADSGPSKDHGWQQIQEDIRIIMRKLEEKIPGK